MDVPPVWGNEGSNIKQASDRHVVMAMALIGFVIYFASLVAAILSIVVALFVSLRSDDIAFEQAWLSFGMPTLVPMTMVVSIIIFRWLNVLHVRPVLDVIRTALRR